MFFKNKKHTSIRKIKTHAFYAVLKKYKKTFLTSME